MVKRAFVLFVALSIFGGMSGAVFAQDVVPQSRGQITYSFAPIVDKTLPAVVNIHARKVIRSKSPTAALDGSAFWRLFRDTLLFGYGRERFVNSLGSGVIVSPGGLVVTNHHVIQSAQGILVSLSDGRVFPGQVILSDKRTDIAILRIPISMMPLPYVEFGDSDQLKIGDMVVAIGNPFGIGQTVTSGIVSARSRATSGVADFRFFIQTDAAINPGNSGGPLISTAGKLVGINTAIYSSSGGSQGLGFAVPINMVRPILESAIKGRPYLRPWIGISGQKLPPTLAMMLDLNQKNALVVTGIFPDGPAAIAGLKKNDIILTLDGKSVVDSVSLNHRIASHLAGDEIDLGIMRKGTMMTIKVTLISPPDVPARNDMWLPNLSPFAGAKVASLSPAFAMDYGLESIRGGVVVLEVRLGSAAAKFGLKRGDIIRDFNGKKIIVVADMVDLKLPRYDPWVLKLTRSGRDVAVGSKKKKL
ncbi:MAG: serine protease [Hyphomicrobiales bacterium]|nr:MAG: serine protease [Hyphomicrobiales bacterium]